MKTITVLGSTGSVGRQVLDVILQHKSKFKVVGLSAHSNDALLREQIEIFKPQSYFFPSGAVEIQSSLFDFLDDSKQSKCLKSLEELAEINADITVLAVTGIAGLWSAVAVLKRGGVLAIANKETIVCAGRHLKELEKRYGGKILPLDTEHSAIFECLIGENTKFVKKLHLTASGGALRDLPLDKLAKTKPADALKHPVWKMGQKVTIDSATLFNKGLEVIEAVRLFDAKPDMVEVLMHRESIIHSLVEFSDGGQKALLSMPDMRLAIETALFYPERSTIAIDRLDLAKIGTLNFSRPDFFRYPCLKICMDAVRAGEGACIALSASDEVLVDMFCDGKIKFGDIATVLEKVLKKFKNIKQVELDDIIALDQEARKFTYHAVGVKK